MDTARPLRLAVPLLLLVSLLAVAQPTQAVVCGPVEPVGDFAGCLYDTATDFADEQVHFVLDAVDCLLYQGYACIGD